MVHVGTGVQSRLIILSPPLSKAADTHSDPHGHTIESESKLLLFEATEVLTIIATPA